MITDPVEFAEEAIRRVKNADDLAIASHAAFQLGPEEYLRYVERLYRPIAEAPITFRGDWETSGGGMGTPDGNSGSGTGATPENASPDGESGGGFAPNGSGSDGPIAPAE